jgi:hypothetical protein
MIDGVNETSNSISVHREPPPSSGMVAHIWAGHLGPVEPDGIDVVVDGSPVEAGIGDELDSGVVRLPEPRDARVKAS